MPNDQKREAFLSSAITAIGPDNAARFLALAPFGEAHLVAGLLIWR